MNDSIQDFINKGVALRLQAKTLEEEARSYKDEANALFKVALEVSGTNKIKHDEGTVSRVTRSRSTLNKEKLAAVLVAKGVKAGIVADSISDATDTKEITSIEFRVNKKKEE